MGPGQTQLEGTRRVPVPATPPNRLAAAQTPTNGGQPAQTQPNVIGSRFQGQGTDGINPPITGQTGIVDPSRPVQNRGGSLDGNLQIQELQVTKNLGGGTIGCVYSPRLLLCMLAKAFKEGRLDEFIQSFTSAAARTLPGTGEVGRGIRPLLSDGQYGPPGASSLTTGIGETWKLLGASTNDGSFPPFVRIIEVFLSMYKEISLMSDDTSGEALERAVARNLSSDQDIQGFVSKEPSTLEMLTQMGLTYEDVFGALRKTPDLPGKLTKLTNVVKENTADIRQGDQQAQTRKTDLREKINEIESGGKK